MTTDFPMTGITYPTYGGISDYATTNTIPINTVASPTYYQPIYNPYPKFTFVQPKYPFTVDPLTEEAWKQVIENMNERGQEDEFLAAKWKWEKYFGL